MLRVSSCLMVCVLLIPMPSFAWQPTGSLEELYDATLLPRLRPGVKAAAFTSYARKGGNDDGFPGKTPNYAWKTAIA